MEKEYDMPCSADLRHGGETPVSLRLASSISDKVIGYMGARFVRPGSGIVYERGRSVHTLFMRVPIDICWIGPYDDESRSWPVISLDAAVRPWRILFAPRGAVGAIEVACGTFSEADRPLSIRRLG